MKKRSSRSQTSKTPSTSLLGKFSSSENTSSSGRGQIAKNIKNRLPLRLKVSQEKMRNITSILPNLTTVMALCMGLTGVRFALLGRWELAVGAVLLAGILDAMDGRIARLLNSTSRFGAELDSLSDFISFGVTPPLILYVKTLHMWKGYGWLFVLYFTTCMALRLARFNTMSIEGTSAAWSSKFFIGTPAPVTAILALTPTMIAIEFPEVQLWGSPLMNALVLFVMGTFAISRIPVYSFKKMNISQKYVVPMIIAGALILGLAFVEPWLTISGVFLAYLGLIPFSIRSFQNLEKEIAEDSSVS